MAPPLEPAHVTGVVVTVVRQRNRAVGKETERNCSHQSKRSQTAAVATNAAYIVDGNMRRHRSKAAVRAIMKEDDHEKRTERLGLQK